MMKRSKLLLTLLAAMFFIGTSTVSSQEIKTNLPLILAGTPNVGIEWDLTSRLTVNGDVLWMPYMFKKTESVFRTLIGSVDVRWYVKPKYYYTNDHFDGFYIGPYVMMGNYNIGIRDGSLEESYRHKGWGISAGASLGYKFYISNRLRLDINLGLGYAHLQHDKYQLGGIYAKYPIEKKNTVSWIGPTKFGVHLSYILF